MEDVRVQKLARAFVLVRVAFFFSLLFCCDLIFRGGFGGKQNFLALELNLFFFSLCSFISIILNYQVPAVPASLLHKPK